MNPDKQFEKTAERLDEIIKLKGIAEWLDYFVLKASLKMAYIELEKWSPDAAIEFIELCVAFNTLSYTQMADEGADLIAEIVKKLWIVKFK